MRGRDGHLPGARASSRLGQTTPERADRAPVQALPAVHLARRIPSRGARSSAIHSACTRHSASRPTPASHPNQETAGAGVVQLRTLSHRVRIFQFRSLPAQPSHLIRILSGRASAHRGAVGVV